jgi:hypothetical protein
VLRQESPASSISQAVQCLDPSFAQSPSTQLSSSRSTSSLQVPVAFTTSRDFCFSSAFELPRLVVFLFPYKPTRPASASQPALAKQPIDQRHPRTYFDCPYQISEQTIPALRVFASKRFATDQCGDFLEEKDEQERRRRTRRRRTLR